MKYRWNIGRTKDCTFVINPNMDVDPKDLVGRVEQEIPSRHYIVSGKIKWVEGERLQTDSAKAVKTESNVVLYPKKV